MAAAAPPIASSSGSGRLIPFQDTSELLRIRLQKQKIEDKFDQVRRDRQAAHALRAELEQARTNEKTDEQIMLLMQADERLAALLSQAADSMCALLPAASKTGEASSSVADPDGPSAHGAKAFEIRAQSWFVILNEVQYTMRSAMRHLRDAQVAPLTAPVGPEARNTGFAGSAVQGHSLSLMNAFVDTSGTDGSTFKLPPLSRNTPKLSQLSSVDRGLSLHALREKDRNWKNLSQSLQEVEKSLDHAPVSKAGKDSTTKSDDAAIAEGFLQQRKSDNILLQALLNANGLAS